MSTGSSSRRPRPTDPSASSRSPPAAAFRSSSKPIRSPACRRWSRSATTTPVSASTLGGEAHPPAAAGRSAARARRHAADAAALLCSAAKASSKACDPCSPTRTSSRAVNGEGNPIVARREASQVLAAAREIDVIFAMDDETAHGAFQGYCDAGLDPARRRARRVRPLRRHRKDWLTSRGALKVSAAMFPGTRRRPLHRRSHAARRRLAGPGADVVPTVPMTADRLASSIHESTASGRRTCAPSRLSRPAPATTVGGGS